MTSTITGVSFIHVGTSPSGVEYNVYTERKSKAQIAKEVAIQKQRLKALHARHDCALVKVKLSEAAIDYIDAYYSEADAGEEFETDFGIMTRGKTFIKASRRLLRDMAAVLDEFEDDIANGVACDPSYTTPNQADFAERAVRACITTAVRKLRAA